MPPHRIGPVPATSSMQQPGEPAVIAPAIELPNAAALGPAVGRQIAKCRRDHYPFAVVCIGIAGPPDGAHRPGLALEHGLLCAAWARLAASLRVTDARLYTGGGSFGIVVDNVSPSQAVRVAARLARVLDQPYRIDGHDLHVTFSSGLATFPIDGDDGDGLVALAQQARYAQACAGATCGTKLSLVADRP